VSSAPMICTVMTTIPVPPPCVTAPIHKSLPTRPLAAKTVIYVQVEMYAVDEYVSQGHRYDVRWAPVSVVVLSSRCVSPIQHLYAMTIPVLPHVSMAVPSLALLPTVMHVQIRIPMVSVMT